MNQIFGKVFRTSDGSDYGVIRTTSAPPPEELSESDVIAEDECGNYFVRENRRIHFWDHETREFTTLANSINEFIAGCAAPSEVELEPGQVKSVWVDPEFAKKFGIDSKPQQVTEGGRERRAASFSVMNTRPERGEGIHGHRLEIGSQACKFRT